MGGDDAGDDHEDDRGDDDVDEALRDVLRHIDEVNLLPPLLVVQIVSSNPRVPLGVLRDYIVTRLDAQEKRISEVCTSCCC